MTSTTAPGTRPQTEERLPRGLGALVRTMLLLEASMYSAVAPVLPHYARAFGMSKAAIGILAAAYTAGLIPGALLAGWLVTRVGVRRTLLTGLVTFAGAIVAFGVAGGPVALDGLRATQGIGCGLIWGGGLTWAIVATARRRRGAMLGSVMASATVGTLVGPALGALAVTVGTGPVFAGLGALQLVLIPWLLAYPEPIPDGAEAATSARALARSRPLQIGVWLITLEAVAVGAENALVPLRLSRLGASGLAIGATFLVAAGGSALAGPVAGRVSDRRGTARPIVVGLLVSAVLLAALPVPRTAVALVVLSMVALGAPLTGWMVPASSLLSRATEDAGGSAQLATTLFNLAYAAGETAGAPAAAVLSQATTDAVPFVLLALLMVASALVVLARHRRRRAAAASG